MASRKQDDSSLGRSGTIDPQTIVSQLAAQDKVPWYCKPNLRLLYFIILPTCLGVEMTSGFDSSLMNGLQAVNSWNAYFNHPTKTILGLMSSMYSLGSLVSLPFVPIISDKFGRRMAIIFGSVVMVVGALIQCFSHNHGMFIGARLILGFGIPFAIVGASSLLGELGHPKERPILGSLFNACWFIGSIVAAGTTLGTYAMKSEWGWRLPSILQVAPSVLQLLFVWFLPESPRWLMSKGRGDEALAILVKYHAEGDSNSEFAKAEYAQIEQTLAMEKESSKTTWLSLVQAPGLRRRIIICSVLGLFTQWSGNGLISYFLSVILENIGIKDSRTKNLINLGNSCWGFVNAMVLALTVPRFKRRTMYLTSAVTMLLVYISLTISSAQFTLTNSHSASIATLFFIFLYSPCYNIGYNALTYTFLVELFPFRSRAKGIVVFQAFGRFAGFFNQFVNPIAFDAIGWKLYAVYCGFLAFEVAFIYMMFPETQGRTLEELAFLFEGDQVQEQRARVERQLQHDQRGDKASSDEKIA